MIEKIIAELNPVHDLDRIRSKSLKDFAIMTGLIVKHGIRGSIVGGILGTGAGALMAVIYGSDISTYSACGAAIGISYGAIVDTMQYTPRALFKFLSYPYK